MLYVPGPEIGALHDWLYAELDAFEPIAIEDLPNGDGWRVFFRAGSQREDARAALSAAVGERLVALSPTEIEDEDWARRSQAALSAIQAGRITVAPPWDIPEPGTAGESITIVIEPSMGFGTGHHATTRLCLELLQTLDVTNKYVIDVGTGSGVLAIAASCLGARRVTAVDNDPDALQNARDNIAYNFPMSADTHISGELLNQTPGRQGSDIEVIEAELSALEPSDADIVLANLTGAVLQRHAAALRRMRRADGVLIVSGFSPGEIDDVVRALALPVAETRIDGEWAAAVLGSSAGRQL
ncbi:MAG: ribosomal protein methyltransferase [Acidobacteriota bacterium]